MLRLPEADALRTLSRDGRLLLFTRLVRMFAYGFLAVVLALYLAQVGLNEGQIGLLLSTTLIGDAVISLGISAVADRIGRLMLMIGAGLMIFAGVVFALSGNIVLLTIAAIIGTISPSGNEVGPFLSIEHAALPQTSSETRRTGVFAWYNLFGSFATALGALCGGSLASVIQSAGGSLLASYRAVIVGYALLARYCISQMDVPTRQSYLVAVVDPDERSAAALSPLLTGALMGASLLNVPFFLAGGLKIVYDLALYRSFRAVKPPEETRRT
jgi:MFS family permease